MNRDDVLVLFLGLLCLELSLTFIINIIVTLCKRNDGLQLAQAIETSKKIA